MRAAARGHFDMLYDGVVTGGNRKAAIEALKARGTPSALATASQLLSGPDNATSTQPSTDSAGTPQSIHNASLVSSQAPSGRLMPPHQTSSGDQTTTEPSLAMAQGPASVTLPTALSPLDRNTAAAEHPRLPKQQPVLRTSEEQHGPPSAGSSAIQLDGQPRPVPVTFEAEESPSGVTAERPAHLTHKSSQLQALPSAELQAAAANLPADDCTPGFGAIAAQRVQYSSAQLHALHPQSPSAPIPGLPEAVQKSMGPSPHAGFVSHPGRRAGRRRSGGAGRNP